MPHAPGHAPADLITRAGAIAATLVDRQAETEKRTFYAPDTHDLFRESGFYRILVPRRYGGLEHNAETFLRVTAALARGCPSTGWMYCLGSAHALAVATMFDEPAQAELFAGTDFICPAVVAPSGSARRTEDGHWRLDGIWKYCSGSPYATHFIGHTLVAGADGGPPEPMLFVAPRSEWTRLDDWGGQLGLKGSGSHSIVLENGLVPGHFTLSATHLSNVSVTGGTPGLRLHGNPQYAGGPLGFMFLEFAALAVGMAQGALDAYEELMRTRTTLFPPIVGRSENPDYQVWYGNAAGLIDTAETAMLGAARRWSDVCAQGPAAFTREQDLRIAGICREVIRLCWSAVEQYIFPTAGSSSAAQGARIERVWRDMSMLRGHAGYAVFLPTIANRAFTTARFAGDFAAFDTRV